MRVLARAVVAGLACLALVTSATPTHATPTDAGASRTSTRTAGSGNPLTAGPLGVYRGDQDGVYPAYQRAKGKQKRLLAKVALQPRMRWFGQWIPVGGIETKVRDHVRGIQAGDPDVIVPMAIFRLWPRTEAAKHQPLTRKDRRQYKRWIDRAAAGIGGARVVMVLEPDLPVALTGWRPKVRLKLTRYAARVFGDLPRTVVYLDAGDSDWLRPDAAVDMLRRAGVEHARGFALGATHYASVGDGVRYAGEVAGLLARSGLPGKHAVIDTADNGRPFTWLQYWAKHPRGDFDNAEVCRKRSSKRCVTLGIPPTTDVSSARWGLPPTLRSTAAEHVDAYLWFGRPWLYRQAAPFKKQRTLQIARTTPWPDRSVS